MEPHPVRPLVCIPTGEREAPYLLEMVPDFFANAWPGKMRAVNGFLRHAAPTPFAMAQV